MDDRRHLRRRDDDDLDRSPAPHRERRDHATDPLRDLQRRAGNRAVAELLSAPDAGRTPLQRQPTDQRPGAERTDDRQPSAAGTMSIPDLELTVPILSFSRQVSGPRQPKDESGEVVVSIALDKLDPRIAQAVSSGKQFASITVVLGSTTLTLSDVIFASFNVGSEIATLSLNFQKIEVGKGAAAP